ncbi:MAG: alpha/beta fold hydrolase [Myxococcales bacterium]|nr:alpha/beta fold hydrolase [Myxococcales bacterium]
MPADTQSRGRLIGPGDPAAILHDGRGPPILGIHGFGGTPLEVGVVADAAQAIGRRVHLPLLPGHGTHADDLAKVRWPDWAQAVESALERAAPEGEPAIVVGLSLGSLLATHLAVTRSSRVKALVLLGNAFWLTSPFPAWALRAVDLLKIPDFRMPKVAADLADPEARRTHLTYGQHPVHAAVEVERAGRALRARLSEVRVPTLILHGARDRVCPAKNAQAVASRLGTKDVRVVILPRSRHILTRDLERAQVLVELRQFFEQHAG